MRSERVLVAVFGGGFPLIGIILLVIGFFSYRTNQHAIETGVLTTGSVVGMAERYDDDGSMYAPIIRFTTLQGEVVEFTSSTWSRPAEYGPGDSVQILYQPDAPHGAQIDSAFNRYGMAAILGTIGTFFAFVGAVVGFAMSRLLFSGPTAQIS
jgi:hypothetical protein